VTETYDLFQLGRSHLRSGMPAQATVPLEKAKRAEPTSRSIREALGIAYFRIGRWEEAEAEFRALVELAPADEFAHSDLSNLFDNVDKNFASSIAQNRSFTCPIGVSHLTFSILNTKSVNVRDTEHYAIFALAWRSNISNAWPKTDAGPLPTLAG